jgi:hypothetical protein
VKDESRILILKEPPQAPSRRMVGASSSSRTALRDARSRASLLSPGPGAYLRLMSSTAFIFDRLAYVDRLRAAGVDESQARAHAEALDVALRDGVASKTDIDRLETKLSSDIDRLEAKIETTTTNLKVEIRAGWW